MKKDERLTLPEQTRIPSDLKRELIESAEADIRQLSDEIVLLLMYGLKLRSAIISKEVNVHIGQLASGFVRGARR